ncbi:MAG: DPP IV N-terminal domain-containing protein [Bacteroidaceae bacterium]|nr:DPP IV N-terminal domain-containing protein [Bacteroidaceae bacterium]
MKHKHLFLLSFLFACCAQAFSQEQLTVEDVTKSSKFRAAYVKINDYLGSGRNALISADGKYEIEIGKKEQIYRHSFTAEFDVKETATGKTVHVSGKNKIPTWSPDSKNIAVVRDNNIYIIDVESLFAGKPLAEAEKAVTTDGEFNKIINGHADWVYEEEFAQTSMFAFTGDGSAIAWIRSDESAVKEMQLQFHEGEDYPRIYRFKYPKAGEKNSVITLHSYVFATGEHREIKMDIDAEDYLPIIRTIPSEPDDVLICSLNRHQDAMTLWRANSKNAQTTKMQTLTSKCYLPEQAVTEFALYPEGMVILNDNEGTMQPYLYDYNGKLIRPLINDKSIIVTELYGYNYKTGETFFQAVGKTPMQRTVCKTDKKGRLTTLSAKEGWNKAYFSSDFKKRIDVYSNMTTPPVYTLCEGKKQTVIEDNAKLKQTLAGTVLPQKEFFTFTTSDGIELNGVIYKPANFDAAKKYPVIFHQYSGPGSQQVTDSWSMGCMGSGGMFEAMLCQKGYVCVTIDPRGTTARGADFQKMTYMRMGEKECRDHVESAKYIATQPWADKSRFAIWGWSHGGFTTLMSMTEGEGTYRCGVSIAPPTDFRFYDTVYTERFMRTPQENAAGYDINPCKRAANLHGDLLLIHGLCDDNVHPQNTFEFTQKLVDSDIPFDMHIFTNSNHSIYYKNSRLYLMKKVVNFFDEKLK